MNWAIDPPVRIGRNAVAAIVETRISVRSTSRALVADGEKRPILFLLRLDDATCGIDGSGHVYEAEEIENLYPQAIAHMTALLGKLE
ncbi:hypothetical protein MUY35_01155 [Aliiroseovarius sp. S1339]|uniref:hypothetical protein n=1 Tax=Aliiroseovarius sp. S1339 TaxID=2936990 RepID=UPI0020BE2806|nr:hypothetical protein [Aliiroseovarius sp. S1339]MCK8462454.1 hypothetical protein [Aliiroseovarius sp. S1339]